MCTNHYKQQAVDSIERANISAPEYRTARRLLDLVGEDGNARLSYVTIFDIIGSKSDGTMRRQLADLKRAGILEYHCNGAVEIDFIDYPPRVQCAKMITVRAEMITQRADDDTDSAKIEPQDSESCAYSEQPRAHSDQIRSPGDQIRAYSDHEPLAEDAAHNKDHACAHARVGWLVGNIYTPDLQEPTNQPQPNEPLTDTPAAPLTTGALDPAEQAWSYSLLTAVLMRPSNAKRLAASYPFLRIRDAVAHWHANRKSMGGKFEETPGIVVSWFDNPDTFTAPPTPPDWLRSELGQRYATQAELAALREQPSTLSPYITADMAHVIRY